MNVIDHLSVGVTNIEMADRFYTPLLEALGIARLAKSDGFVAYGIDQVQFLLMLPENGEAASAGNGVHVSFVASTKTQVSNFHAYAVASGGESAGEPGPREGYPIPDVYTTFVRDPFGNKLEAIFNGFAGSADDE